MAKIGKKAKSEAINQHTPSPFVQKYFKHKSTTEVPCPTHCMEHALVYGTRVWMGFAKLLPTSLSLVQFLILCIVKE